MAEAKKEATLLQIKEYFGMSSAEAKEEWTELSADDKSYFKKAVGEVVN